MEWALLAWGLWATLVSSYGVPNGPANGNRWPDAGTTGEIGPPAGPTGGDLFLIQVFCEVIAAQSRCANCGALLRRRLRLTVRSDPDQASWRVSVEILG